MGCHPVDRVVCARRSNWIGGQPPVDSRGRNPRRERVHSGDRCQRGGRQRDPLRPSPPRPRTAQRRPRPTLRSSEIRAHIHAATVPRITPASPPGHPSDQPRPITTLPPPPGPRGAAGCREMHRGGGIVDTLRGRMARTWARTGGRSVARDWGRNGYWVASLSKYNPTPDHRRLRSVHQHCTTEVAVRPVIEEASCSAHSPV